MLAPFGQRRLLSTPSSDPAISIAAAATGKTVELDFEAYVPTEDQVPAGRVHMIATGLPADGSQAAAGAQRLVNPNHVNPLRKEHVVAWVRERAHRDLTPPR